MESCDKIFIKVWDKKSKEYNALEIALNKLPSIDDYKDKTKCSELNIVGNFERSSNKCQYSTNILPEFRNHIQWIYFLTINNKIIKIGQTTKTLSERWGSYSAGTKQNRDHGTCSLTNYFISELIRSTLELNYDVKLYGYKIENTYSTINILGKQQQVLNDNVKYYEANFIQKYTELYKDKPVLGKNFNHLYP